MDRRRFEEMTEEAFGTLPDGLLAYVDNVVFLVEDWPDTETLEDLGIESRDGLLGLYQGQPRSERWMGVTESLPDRIVLYQKPIEVHARQHRTEIFEIIRETLLHEIGHHFGLSEEDLARLEEG